MNVVTISLEEGILVAALPNGEKLESTDALALASYLIEAGFLNEDVSLIDWHDDMARSPSAGQKIAIHQYLRANVKKD